MLAVIALNNSSPYTHTHSRSLSLSPSPSPSLSLSPSPSLSPSLPHSPSLSLSLPSASERLSEGAQLISDLQTYQWQRLAEPPSRGSDGITTLPPPSLQERDTGEPMPPLHVSLPTLHIRLCKCHGLSNKMVFLLRLSLQPPASPSILPH